MTRGSSKLTPEQADWYLQKFGKRYVHVQAQPGVPNRKQRRGNATRPRRAL